MPRLFIGLDLPATVKAQLQQQQDYFGLVLDASWFKFTAPEQQHLTLIFLGTVSGQNIERLKQAMRFACRKKSPFDISSAQMGAFPSNIRPSIIWAGISDPDQGLQSLHYQLTVQLEGLYKPDTRRYRPHLTLARVKRFGHNESIFNALESAPAYPPVQWTVNTIHLYSSQLLPSGAKYTIIHSEQLNSEEAAQSFASNN